MPSLVRSSRLFSAQADRRPRDGQSHGLGVLLGALLLALGARAAGAQLTVTALQGSLSFGSVLPGQTPVVVAPFANGSSVNRLAAVWRIQGTANATVFVKVVSLPTSVSGPSGGTLALSAPRLALGTTASLGGATTVTPVLGTEYSITLNSSGLAYVSLGATATSASATQTTGTYQAVSGLVLSVR